MGDLHIAFPVILKILANALEEEVIQRQIARRMHEKLDGYWAELQLCCHASVVLDPNVKLSSFNDETVSTVRELIRNIYARYVDEEPSASTSVSGNGSGSRRYFKKRLNASLAGGSHARDVLEDYLSSAEEDCNALELCDPQTHDTLGLHKWRVTTWLCRRQVYPASGYFLWPSTRFRRRVIACQKRMFEQVFA